MTWGWSSGVRFAAKVKICKVQGEQFPVPTVNLRAGTPCRVWPQEEKI